MSAPVLSVVLAVRNEAEHVGAQLAALAGQGADVPWELLVVDNGSTDGTAEVVTEALADLPDGRLVIGPSAASFVDPRNLGLELAAADRIAFCDADDVVADGWVQAMADALGRHELVTGPLELRSLNPSHVLHGDHADRWLVGPPQDDTFRPYAMGCNLGIRRSAVERLGPYDPGLESGHDKELSWRYQLAGVPLHFEESAVVHRRVRTTPGGAFRQHVRYGRSNARLYRRFRAHGMRRSSIARAVLVLGWGVLSSPLLIGSAHRHRWAEHIGLRVGRLAGSFRHRVVYL